MNGVETVASWLTPPVLFCVLNVMIGAIFLRSKLHPPPPRNDRHFLVRVPSFLERVKSFNRSSYLSPQPEPAARELEQPPHPVSSSNAGAEARETQHAPDAAVDAVARETHHALDTAARGTHAPSHVARTKSEAVVRAAPAARPLQKSASERISVLREEEEERWRPATVRERTGGDEEVDEKADEFINNFRQQLKLQRMESLLRSGAGR